MATSSAVKNRWNGAHYDRIYLIVKSGRKDIVQEAADREGISVNEWINRAIRERLDEEGKKKWDE